jgi:gas vesicle protein
MGFIRFVLGAAVGVGLGWVAGRLYAPHSGDELRREARRRYEYIAAEAEKAAEEKRKEMQARYEQAKAVRPA